MNIDREKGVSIVTGDEDNEAIASKGITFQSLQVGDIFDKDI